MNKLLKIDYAFHTHTKRCGHAFGEDEEYVIKAIEQGFKYIGFSDHGMFNDVFDYGRNIELLQDYINSINYLKEKYKEQINIYLGFEYEFDENHIEFYKSLKEKYKFNYFICGQHFFIENKKSHYYFSSIDDYEMIEKYKNSVVAAIKSGLFAYIAHPDLFFNRISIINEKILGFCKEICIAAKEYDVPLEVNLGGLRYGNLVAQTNGCFPYPNKAFFEIAKSIGNKVVIGIDAHIPNDFEKQNELRFAREFVDKLGLDLIENFRIK